MTESEQAYVDALLLQIETLRGMLNDADLTALAQLRAANTTKESKS